MTATTATRRLVAALFLVVLGALLGALTAPAAPAQASPLTGGAGFRDHSYSSSVTAPTGQKPQSKVWHADGSWWGVLWTAASPRRFEIHKFNLATQSTNAWTKTGTVVDTRRNSQADTLFDSGNNKLYVLSHLKDTDTSTSDQGLKFLRFGYNSATKAYTQEVSKTIVSKKAEAAVLDKDSTGKLWVTYTDTTGGGRSVFVTHSTTNDTTYVAPYVLPVAGANNLATDDISTLVAYGDAGGRKIGVLWSNQIDDAVYFAAHPDGSGDAAANWTRTTLCAATLCPDDHLNIKSIDADTSGHIFAAVKTSLNDKNPQVGSDPLIVIYRLNTAGGWTSSVAWRVAENVTRSIVVIDSQNRRVHAFAAGPCCDGGTIWTKSAPLDNPTFEQGAGTAFIRNSNPSAQPANNPTSTKQAVNNSTGLLVLASIDQTRDYVHNFLLLGGAPPPTPTPTPTPSPPPPGGQTVTLTATADSYVTSDSPTANFGTSALLNVDASPTAHSYLKFELSPYAGRTVTSAVLQVRATTSGSSGTQNVKLVTDDGWTETGLNFTNAPARGTVLGSLGPTSGNTNYSVSLSAPGVQGQLGGPLSLGLDSTSTDGVDLGSRETSTPPRLVITLTAA